MSNITFMANNTNIIKLILQMVCRNDCFIILGHD